MATQGSGRNTNTNSNPNAHATDRDPRDETRSGSERDQANRDRFVAPPGVEASDLPDQGRPTGHSDTPIDVARRNMPQQHGGEQLESDADDFTGRSEGGLRGDRDLGDASIRGHGGGRGKN